MVQVPLWLFQQWNVPLDCHSFAGTTWDISLFVVSRRFWHLPLPQFYNARHRSKIWSARAFSPLFDEANPIFPVLFTHQIGICQGFQGLFTGEPTDGAILYVFGVKMQSGNGSGGGGQLPTDAAKVGWLQLPTSNMVLLRMFRFYYCCYLAFIRPDNNKFNELSG